MTREEAIRIFRKEIECLSHTKCEDCILEKACDPMNTTSSDSEYIEAYSMAIKALEQEPFINKPCVSEKVCEHDKNVVLDKIRDQLKSHLRGVEIALDVLVKNDPLRAKMEGAKSTLEECLELIDKAETEG